MFNSRWQSCSTVAVRLFSHWHNCLPVAGMVIRQSLARWFNSYWHDSSLVAGTIVQQSLARLFNSHWYDCSTVADTVIQQSLARMFSSHWHDCLTVTGAIIQQWLARFFLFSMLAKFFNSGWQDFLLFSMLEEFFNSDVHCWRIVPCTRNTTHDLKLLLRRSQNFDLLGLKVLSPGQFLGGFNSCRYHWILKLLVPTLKSEV